MGNKIEARKLSSCTGPRIALISAKQQIFPPCHLKAIPVLEDRNAIETDIAQIQRMHSVPTVLQAVVELTGLRFAALARVTDTSWTVCAVHDEMDFGLQPGGDLELETTICNEIRQHHQLVIFNHASVHPIYSQHPTPMMYKLESYVSVPIFRRNGDFFGTLCAVDSQPARMEELLVLKPLRLFADMIGMQLELAEDLSEAQSLLRDARFRERLLSSSEHEIRDLLQPIITNLYLLRTSSTLSEADRRLVDEMDASSQPITQLLRQKLDIALGRMEQHLSTQDAAIAQATKKSQPL